MHAELQQVVARRGASGGVQLALLTAIDTSLEERECVRQREEEAASKKLRILLMQVEAAASSGWRLRQRRRWCVGRRQRRRLRKPSRLQHGARSERSERSERSDVRFTKGIDLRSRNGVRLHMQRLKLSRRLSTRRS